MPDVSRPDYIVRQIARSGRISRLKKRGEQQLSLQGSLFSDGEPPPLVEGTTKTSPEQQDINRRGLDTARAAIAENAARHGS